MRDTRRAQAFKYSAAGVLELVAKMLQLIMPHLPQSIVVLPNQRLIQAIRNTTLLASGVVCEDVVLLHLLCYVGFGVCDAVLVHSASRDCGCQH